MKQRFRKLLQVCRDFEAEFLLDALADHGFKTKWFGQGLCRETHLVSGLPVLIKMDRHPYDEGQSRQEINTLHRILTSTRPKMRALIPHLPRVYYARVSSTRSVMVVRYYPDDGYSWPNDERWLAVDKLRKKFKKAGFGDGEICGNNVKFKPDRTPVAVDLGI